MQSSHSSAAPVEHTEPDMSSARQRSTFTSPTQVGTELGTAVGNEEGIGVVWNGVGLADGISTVGLNVGPAVGIGVVGAGEGRGENAARCRL